MTSILPPPAGASPFRERMGRHEPMLGVLVDHQPPPGLLSAVDFVVLRASAPFGLVQSLREPHPGRVPVLLLVTSAEELAAAASAGVDGVIADASSEVSDLDGVDAELAERGRARLATSAAAARTAFASGAELVVYNFPSILAGVVSDLGEGRPSPERDTGREVLVLLSGMLGDAALWDGVIGQLDGCVLPSPSRIDLDDSVAEMAASVLAEAPSRFALAGHSLGAIVALEIMRQQPERVTRLALVNASARGPVDEQLAAWALCQERVARGEFDQIAADLALATVAPDRREDALLVAANRGMAETVGPEGFVRQLRAQATRPDSLASIEAITVPVLVVSGGVDEICPPALQRELAERCPTAELVSISGAGHMLPLENPAELARYLGSWLAVTRTSQ